MKRILNYPGSKWGMAEWIINHMPKHDVYLEPYFGSGAIFFNKSPVKLEIIYKIKWSYIYQIWIITLELKSCD